jgi:hypothetical protein
MKVEDIRMYIESCWKMGGMGDKGVRESNGRAWLDQSKGHPQWAYIDTPLWIST